MWTLIYCSLSELTGIDRTADEEDKKGIEDKMMFNRENTIKETKRNERKRFARLVTGSDKEWF